MEDPEGDPHGGGDADGRGAADDHVLDGGSDFEVGAAGDEGLFERQAGLVDHDDARGGPFNGFDHGNSQDTRRRVWPSSVTDEGSAVMTHRSDPLRTVVSLAAW